MEIFESIILKLKAQGKYVSTMESCTGGGVANEITNHSGASEVLKFSAVTYSNEFKIKMGVSSAVIDKYSVYSMETAKEMAKNISEFTGSDYGIGVTGKINTPDPENPRGEDDEIFISIYDANKKVFHPLKVEAISTLERDENKGKIITAIGKLFLEILEEEDK
ncbi:MAG: CinA family protein [Erysipelotrichales bacterium]|nr:CinA family protein [Erysipelotrichales bacterium]